MRVGCVADRDVRHQLLMSLPMLPRPVEEPKVCVYGPVLMRFLNVSGRPKAYISSAVFSGFSLRVRMTGASLAASA